MTEFQAEIQTWHDFFALSGAASATLIGLLFVAITLRTDIRKADASSLVRVVVTHNFAVLLTAAVPAVLLGKNWLRLRHTKGLERLTIFWSFLVPMLCYLASMGVGLALIVNDDAEIAWFTTITAMFLVIPTKNSWVIILQSQEEQSLPE